MWDDVRLSRIATALDCILNSNQLLRLASLQSGQQSTKCDANHAEAKLALDPEQRKGIIEL